MDEKSLNAAVLEAADGSFEKKIGNTTYRVSVYFKHGGGPSARAKMAQYVQQEVLKEVG